MFRVEIDTREWEQLLRRMARQLPYATSRALNATAKIAQEEERKEIGRVFDAPTPFTQKATFVTYATKERLHADVFLRDEAVKGTPPAKFLLAQIAGGPRAPKRHELALRSAGILGSREFTAPGKDMRLNRYGNLSAGTYVKILSQLRASRDPTQNAPLGKVGRRYFYSRGEHLPRNIYERYGARARKARPALAIVKQPVYSKRLDFQGVVERTARVHFPREFHRALRQALKTAR
ncbi:MAG: hypothetical protein AMXMBFR8_26850 [Nevskiales bacterium]